MVLVLCGGSQLGLDQSLPPRRCACVQLGTKGSVARDEFASRLRFPLQILCVVTGKDDAEVFCFAPGTFSDTFPNELHSGQALSAVRITRLRSFRDVPL